MFLSLSPCQPFGFGLSVKREERSPSFHHPRVELAGGAFANGVVDQLLAAADCIRKLLVADIHVVRAVVDEAAQGLEVALLLRDYLACFLVDTLVAATNRTAEGVSVPLACIPRWTAE